MSSASRRLAAVTTRADYGDAAALKAFAAAVDVVTLEWENVDREAVRQLASTRAHSRG